MRNATLFRLALTLAAGGLAGPAAGQTTYTWTGAADTGWATPGNWTPAGPPTAGSNVQIGSAANAPQLTSSSAGMNRVTVNDTAAGANLTVTTNAGSLGTNLAYVGGVATGDAAGTGAVTVSNRGKVTATDSFVGYGGLVNGSSFAAANGSILVTGTQSRWTNTNGLRVGELGGIGTATVAAGGKLQSDYTIIGNYGNYSSVTGVFTPSDGTMNVTGTNSQWLATSANVGLSGGKGTLTVDGGASANVSYLNVGSYVDYSTGTRADGTATFSGANTQLVNQLLYVGTSGGDGKLSADGGAQLFGNSLSVGDSYAIVNGTVLQSTGSLTLKGVDAGTERATAWYGYNVQIGTYGGKGTLSIESGAQMTAQYGSVGYSVYGTNNVALPYAQGDGTVTVKGVDAATGISSDWNLTSHLFVGTSGGKGSLSIEAGGQVSNSNAYVGSLSGGYTDYTNPNNPTFVTVPGNGSVVVKGVDSGTGVASAWNVKGTLYVGYSNATGSVRVESGGQLATNSAVIGSSNTTTGTGGSVVVTGLGSQWVNANYIQVGSTAAGTSGSLTVQNGGSVSTGSLTVGSNGTVTISGGPTPGSLTATTTTINAGGTVVNNGTLTSNVSIQSGGLYQGSGTLNGNLTVGAGGTVSPGNSPGVLSQTGTQTWEGGGNYSWQLANASDTSPAKAGIYFDQIQIAGALTITADGGNPFTVKLSTLSGPNTPGQAPGFSGNSSYTWTLVTASGGITGFGSSNVVLDQSGFQNDLNGGTFSLSQVGNSLNLNFTPAPVPEPATVLALGAVGLGCVQFVRRRVRRAGVTAGPAA